MTNGPSALRTLFFLSLSFLLCHAASFAASQAEENSPKDLPTLKKQLSETEARKGKDDADLIPILYGISGAYRDQGGYIPGLPFAQRALEISQKVHGPDDPQTAGALDFLATMYRLQGDPKSALENYRRALTIVEKALGTKHPAYATLLDNLAEAYLAEGNFGEAESALQKAMTVASEAYGAAAPEVTPVRLDLGELYLRTGRYGKAEESLVYALTIRSEGLDVPLQAGQTTEKEVLFYMAPVRVVLGRLYTVTGLYDKAGPLLQDALKAIEATAGKENPFLEDVLVDLAALSAATGETEKAAAYQKRADEIHDRNIGISHLASSPRPKAFEASIPPSNGIKPYADVRVGDWVVYNGPQGTPIRKVEVIRKTPVVAIVEDSMWNAGGKEWLGGPEQMVNLSGGLKESFDVSESDLKTERTKIKGSEITCSTVVTKQEGKECKIYFAPDAIPVGGLAKVECDGQVVMQAADYMRGK
ncbi:MAG: tetratricopeptide repeat protein [Acidobacteriia bacterium]|nr:tetratricopeptide repeat protein [Terriglobia bacterium]